MLLIILLNLGMVVTWHTLRWSSLTHLLSLWKPETWNLLQIQVCIISNYNKKYITNYTLMRTKTNRVSKKNLEIKIKSSWLQTRMFSQTLKFLKLLRCLPSLVKYYIFTTDFWTLDSSNQFLFSFSRFEKWGFHCTACIKYTTL